MRVLVTGAHSQVGQELIARAPEGFVVVGLGSDELDIRDQRQVEETVGRLPALIINAAYTTVDKAESEPGQAGAVNCESIDHLSRAAEQLGIPLLHISTGYVFSGDAQQGGPTPATDIADTLWTLAQHYQRHGTLHWGVYHFGRSPSCNWFDFVLEIRLQAQSLGILPRAPQLQAISTEQYPLPARRPAWSVLDTGKLPRTYGIQSPDWPLGLRNMLRANLHS